MKSSLSKTSMVAIKTPSVSRKPLFVDVCYRHSFPRNIQTSSSTLTSRLEYPWEAGKVPNDFWKNKKNQRKFVDSLSSKLDIKSPEEWYNITEFKSNGGGSLLTEFKGSIFSCLQSVYPEHQFLPWKFRSSSKRYWNEMKNQRQFFDWLGTQLGLQTWEDWYNVKASTVHDYGGGGMLSPFYGNSMIEALRAIYPEHNWMVWKFARAPKKFWKEHSNQLEYFKWLEGVLKIQNKDDWYRVKMTDIVAHHGKFVLQQHRGSMYRFLQAMYPEHNWIPWKFSKNPKDIWNNISMVRMYLEELAEQLHVTTLDDWYRVSADQLHKLGAGGLVTKYGGLPPLLIACFPEHSWQVSKFWNRAKKSAQRWLRICVEQLLPDHEVHEDYRHPNMRFNTHESMELDVFVPSLKLAFEYHGEQHYRDIYSFSPQRKYEHRDSQKTEMCKERGITLIIVPYWWDKQLASLAATIQSARPDLPLPLMPGQPIPSIAPKK